MRDLRYWRSLGELERDPAFRTWLEREFPEGAADAPDGITRRTMLQLMGASLSLAGLAACRRPVETIVPYVSAPEEIVPGVPLRYATTMPFGTSALGLVVESHEGRPTKIEGNELHPASLGAASAWAQAEIYELYDPDRARTVAYQNFESTWAKLVDQWKTIQTGLAADQGASLAVLLEPFSSPTKARLVAALKRRYPSARVVAYAPLGNESVYAAITAAAGAAYEPVYHFDKARVILSLDSDFLLDGADAVRHARGFNAGRRVGSGKDAMNRLYVVESTMTITGIAADHRLRLQASGIGGFTAALAAELGVGSASGKGEGEAKWIQALARDLKANSGKSLIVAGAHQPAAVHAAVAALNGALGNVGTTVTYVDAKETMRSSTAELKQVAADMLGGKVKTLVIIGGNPVYDAPADLDLAKAMAKVEKRIRVGQRIDETSAACDWHVPEAHFLEAWGDARSAGGPISIVQPLIEPLFGGKSAIEILALLESGEEKSGYDLVRETWKATLGADFDRAWNRVLHDGVLKDSEPAAASVHFDTKALADVGKAPAGEGFEIVFRPSGAIYDGRYANNAWLQEVPEPVSKLTWDNAAVISTETAKSLGVKTGDLARIKIRDKTVVAPVMIVPGVADRSITIALGYGRKAAGRVGNGVGVDAYALRTSGAPGFEVGAQVERAGGSHSLVATHDHWSQEARVIVQEASLEEYRKNPQVALEHEKELKPQRSLWEQAKRYETGPQWGMAIDLNSCIGCNACVIACQSENNIPSVGKDQVSRGREMHWIRIDRYFAGTPEAPESIVFQPVPCQQCENAPCEQVCPVAATVHDSEGLNVMVYNRCIGTRYCSNNCPYKVRRFNFYNFTKDTPEILKMAQNPDVTVRARGVMEKCSYCVQRLNRAKIDAKLAGKPLQDGDVQTACQQTCPTAAIAFGDVRDEKSKVSVLKASDRNYDLLPELNTRPRTTYLMRLRNPNPEIHEA